MKKIGDFGWIIGLAGISFLLLSPITNGGYEALNSAHPYLMGFLKFAVLASMGEMLATRISDNCWKAGRDFLPKMLVWGAIGIIITFMFKLFPLGIRSMIEHGLLFEGQGFAGKLLEGFYTSFVANFAFGPIFMAAHRISDTWIDMRVKGNKGDVMQAIASIDWPSFINMVVFKMIPLFWLPAHTLTFVLPENYRILFAAYLSIVLGVFMAVVKRKGGQHVQTIKQTIVPKSKRA